MGCRLRHARRLRGSRRAAIAMDRGPRRIPGPPRHARHARRPGRAHAVVRARRRRPRSVLRAAAPRSSWSQARRRRSFSFWAKPTSAAAARSLLTRYRNADLDAVFREVVDHWERVLGAVQVKTPDRSMDIILNRWLLYQTLACRIWARTAFYQASGAYGFRDQLQDGMALAVVRPDLTREHLLRAGGAAIRRGRLSALVAARDRRRLDRTGRSHPHQRRCGLARLLRHSIHRNYGRRGGAR